MKRKVRSLAGLRNLPQYKNLSEEELLAVQEKIEHGDADFRVDQVLEGFEKDFDLSNMTVNDQLALQELARIFVNLDSIKESIQQSIHDESDWLNVERLNKIASMLRDDASKLQRDLNITRKARQDSEGGSVVDFIEELKKRAKHFLAERLNEIYCPKCNMLLAKVWVLYPDQDNELNLICGRDGCGYKSKVILKELEDGKNIKVGPPR